MIGRGKSWVMRLELEIIMMGEKIVIGGDGLLGLLEVVVDNVFRKVGRDRGGREYEWLMIVVELIGVGRGRDIVWDSGWRGEEVYKIMIRFLIVGE